jgi:hypothetical protein
MDDHHFSSITKLKNQRKKMLRGQNSKEATHPGFYFISKL